MKNTLVLDESKYRMFINENTNWQCVIKAQVNEIPQLEVMLASAVHGDKKMHCTTNEKNTDNYFYSKLFQQQTEMKKLDEAIDEQQKRLSEDCKLKDPYDIDAFCKQDILRERIKAIEKMYIDLKCNFMSYLSNIV